MSSEWVHQDSGLTLPRGCVVCRTLCEEERLEKVTEIEAASARRGVREAEQVARSGGMAPRRRDELDAFCGWLKRYGLDIIGTVSFSDEYAVKRGVYSLSAGVREARQQLNRVTMKRGRVLGFPNRFVICGEWHPSGRRVPHVHLALESGGMNAETVCTELWAHFFSACGRSRFEPMRDVDVASLYGLKDTVKSNEKDAAGLYLRLTRPAR